MNSIVWNKFKIFRVMDNNSSYDLILIYFGIEIISIWNIISFYEWLIVFKVLLLNKITEAASFTFDI